jgi:two-component system cell cycle sensor histidine kinase/response regulator CckA
VGKVQVDTRLSSHALPAPQDARVSGIPSPDVSAPQNGIAARLALAEEILEYSNRNIELTNAILIPALPNIAPLLLDRIENSKKIASRVEMLRALACDPEVKELLEAAAARCSCAQVYAHSLQAVTDPQKPFEAHSAIARVMLPLLMDNNSWRSFVQFLRAQAQGAADLGRAQGLAKRTQELVIAHEQVKSAVAERKRIAERLSQLASIIEFSTDAIVIHALDGTIVSWNAGAQAVYGYAAPEVLGRSRNFLIPPDQSDELPAMIEQLKRGESVQLCESVHLRKDGQRIDVSMTTSPVKDADHQIVGAVSITRDVSDRKRAEERFQKAFNASPEPITITVVSDGRFLDVNDSFLRVTGYEREEVVGHTSSELNLWQTAEDRQRFVQALETRRSVRDLEIALRTKSGEKRIGIDSAELIEVAGQKCVIALMKDITEQKVLENQLRQAQKMEAIGQLAGGIAHDFNNLLTVITGYCDLLERELPPDESLRRNCEQIRKAGERAASLTRQLLAFSRQQVLEPKVLDLNAVVLDLEKMLRRLIGEDIELNTVLDPHLASVKVDRGQIEQVIMNLVVNARDAMQNGGNLSIRTEIVVLTGEQARRFRPQHPGSYVLLSISDTGVGMDAETQSRIFEPFFTTKHVGHGTGLGLSMVYGIVRQSGGHIWVDSQPGRGATFQIYLPVVNEPVRMPHASSASKRIPGGTETVLLVEDEEALRNLTRDLLIAHGYKVLEGKSPHDAISIAENHGGPIHLLLTDVIMPGMNGRALAEKLSVIRPDLRVVYMSGYTGFRGAEVLPPESVLLVKPFKREDLLARVRERLALQPDPLPA